MGCWEIGALVLLVLVLFPKPFLRYASRWMKTTPPVLPSPVPLPASGDWVEARITQERQLALADVPIWLGGWSAFVAGAGLTWLAESRGSPSPAGRVAFGLALGLALVGAGLGIERLSGWFARCFHAMGVSLLVITLAVAVCRDGSLHPLFGLAFLAVVAATAVALLGSRPGAVALATGALAGALVTVPLDWEEGSSGGLLIPLILIALFPWTWRRGWFAPMALAASGFVVGMVLFDQGDGGLVEWISRSALVAGALLLARMEPRVQGAAWTAAGSAMALIVTAPLSPPRGLVLGLALAAAIWLAHWRAVRPARWTALAALSGVAAFLIALSGRGDVNWSGPALAASFLYLGAAWLTARQGTGDEASSLAVAPLAAAAAAFAVLAPALEIGRGWPGIAAALMTPLLVALAVRLRLPDLGALAIVSAVFCLGWMLVHWEDLGFPGSSPDTPWLLYGFGVPFLATVAAVWIAHRGDAPRFAARMTWVAVAAGMLLAVVAVRQLVPTTTSFWLVAAFLAPLLAFAAYRLLPPRVAP